MYNIHHMLRPKQYLWSISYGWNENLALMEFLFKMTVYFLWINVIVKLFRMNYIWGIWTKLKSSHERIVLHIPFSRIDIPNITQIEAFHRDTWIFNEKITDFDPPQKTILSWWNTIKIRSCKVKCPLLENKQL